MLGFYNYTAIATYLGLLSGVFGVFFAFGGRPMPAVYCLLFSGFLDMFDGKIAATRKRTDDEKRFGVQIDSLSDLLCFGMLPAAIGYGFGLTEWWYILLASLYVLAALIRLAYFNVMEENRQKKTAERRKSYNGLPVTMASGLLPLLCCFRTLIGDFFPYAYLILLCCCGILFLLAHLKIEKAGKKGLTVAVISGTLILIVLILLQICKH